MEQNTALFIDGDNINVNNIKFSLLFNKIKSDYKLLIKRVYGDWKLVQMNVFWDKQITEHGLEEIQISRLAGKNSTDNKIIVDIMDCLFKKPFINKFILLGCDKDYIPVIRYALQLNKTFEVFGLKNQTSLSIIHSCTKYYDINEYIDKNTNKEVFNDIYNLDNKVFDMIENNPIEFDSTEEEYDDEIFCLFDEIVIDNIGIAISDLKKEIKDRNKRDLFGKEFNKLDIFIKTHYSSFFTVKRKGGKFMIYKKN